MKLWQHKKLSLPTSEIDLAYLAGIIDGEGSIYFRIPIRFGKPTFYPVVAISNTNPLLSDFMEEIGLKTKELTYQRPERWKLRYEWKFVGMSMVRSLLMAVLPYLKLKKAHALLLLEIIKQREDLPLRGTWLTPEINGLLQLLKKINFRGKNVEYSKELLNQIIEKYSMT